MAGQCINHNCQSKPNSKLLPANKSVCFYYDVKFRPYSQVCGACLQKSLLYFERTGKRFQNQECIREERLPKRRISSRDSDSDDNNATTAKPNQQISKMTTSLTTALNNTVEPLITKQEELCKSYLVSKKTKIDTANEVLNNFMLKEDKGLTDLYNDIHKFDNQIKFKFDKEINIDDDDDCGDVSISAAEKLPGFPDDIPVKGKLLKRALLLGDKVYGMKYSLLQPWVEGTIKSSVSDTYYHIVFDDGEEKVLSNKNLAYINTSSHAQYPVGSRVIAKFQDTNIQKKHSTDKFYVGLIAEPPKYLNNFRYMIFFDDGYTQYVCHKNIHLVCGASPNASDDVHENVREFVKEYLQKYPKQFMFKFNKNQVVSTELNNVWCSAKVKNVDASLVQLKFLDHKNEHTEWLYRGSNRLSQIYNQLTSNNQDKRVRGTVLTDANNLLKRPYIVLENENTENKKSVNIVNSYNTRKIQKHHKNNGVIKLIEIPANCPKPLPYKHHQCSHLCMSRIHYHYSQTKHMNVLSIPLHYGFNRSIIIDKKSKLKKVVYTTPCGCEIINEDKMYNYLKVTGYDNSQMTIDLFNFDCIVNPLSSFTVPKKFICIQDISYEMEFKLISVVNSELNDLVPKHMKYITERKTTSHINFNEVTKFVCGCDCTDNCEDKKKCSCWQLTYEAPKNYPNSFKDPNIGYIYKRLYNHVFTGIFECNANCKCKKTCLNRVVQEPMKTSLQLFLTDKKGWGVRTLADIPKGSFICTYLGEVRTEKDTENDSATNWGEYLADLDFLETVEDFKDGYESDVVQSEDESDVFQTEDESEDYASSSGDEEFHPSWATKRKMSISESRMSLRKNLQDTNTTSDGKHELSKLNIQQGVESK
ncbi:hypothetical protein ACI65C_005838 [Semiaphis heraclei]